MTADPSPARVAADRGRTERREADETARRRAQEAAVTVETVPPVPAPTPDGQTGTQGRDPLADLMRALYRPATVACSAEDEPKLAAALRQQHMDSVVTLTVSPFAKPGELIVIPEPSS